MKQVKLTHTLYIPRDIFDPGYPQFAIVGRSNVGKSSLINRLFGRKKLARTSQTPGCTRSINYYLVDEKFIIADLPGFGFAKVSVNLRESWRELIDTYFRNVAQIKGVAVLIDSKRKCEEAEADIFQYLSEREIPGLFLYTKIDRLKQKERAILQNESLAQAFEFTNREPIYFSAKTGEGKNKLTRAIRELVLGKR